MAIVRRMLWEKSSIKPGPSDSPERIPGSQEPIQQSVANVVLTASSNTVVYNTGDVIDLTVWTLDGANAIIALRCCKLSGRFDEFWVRRSQATRLEAA